MKKYYVMTFVLLLAAVLIMMPESALAQTAGDPQDAGEDLLSNFIDLVTGSMGTLIGLGIALFGLYMWLIQQASWGIIVMIGGVALTAFPGLFDWMREGFASATDGEGSGSSTAGEVN